MRVLFLHPNFPGQFRHPAAHLAQAGHEVRFLCQTHYGRTLPGVDRICLKGPLGDEALNRGPKGLQRTLHLADQFRQGMLSLRAQGWAPDVVVSHSGWGCGLDARDVFPKARLISYLEWWFAETSPIISFDPDNPWLRYGPADQLALRRRNLPLAAELAEADRVISPTLWQREQLPSTLRQHCTVVPDAVDLEQFQPNPANRNPTPLLTYGTRGMEAIRAFPEFVEALPEVLTSQPKLSVEIGGEDRIAYGGQPPREGSFGRWAQARLEPWIRQGRVKFVGYQPLPRYSRWLQRSWMHCQLSWPFVASWSLLEAMASGCCIVASDVEPLRELLTDEAAAWVNHRRPGAVAETLIELMSQPARRQHLGETAHILAHLNSKQAALRAWEGVLKTVSDCRSGN